MCTDLTPELVHRALDGNLNAQNLLVEGLTPEIHDRVARMLRRWRTGPAAARNLRQEIEDMVQEVFLEVWKADCKVLRRWDPARLPLCAYVGYIATIRTAQILRSPRSQWREAPNSHEELDRPDRAKTPEEEVSASERLGKIYLCLIAFFKPEILHIFRLRFVEELSPQKVAEETGRTLDAVYKWISRMRVRARECRDRLSRKSS